MSGKKHIYFEHLKTKIVAVMQETHPGINSSIAEWKGQDITDFQEDLRIRANANISEKWFYTHMKSGQPSVPRIDMLNLLCKYAGYSNWDDFVFKNNNLTGIKNDSPSGSSPKNQNRYFYLVPLLGLVVVVLFYGLFKMFNTQQYRFCFYDADTHEPITGCRIEVTLLSEGETPVQNMSGTDGCFSLKTDKSLVNMVVKAPYYRTDTIKRIIRKLNRNEMVMLHADDYALMIHYFSVMQVDDWEKRRSRLEAMIDDGAMICQVVSDKTATGMALYNKEEFINRMTIPSGNLKNIEILNTQMRDNKIVVLRFRINEKKK
ncbi:MAG: hypothetical protein NTW10_01925 [Bacteroidetes bacterium]|nr:hypothetical protein [Bacteroidota bacterium]